MAIRKKITIITPCYNEVLNIKDCIEAVRELFQKTLTDYDYEHIVSDNCSTDDTISILKDEAQRDGNLKVIFNSRNFGIFRSMHNALERSTGDAAIPFLPVDMQDPPSMIPEFVRQWESGYEIVAGQRVNRGEGRVNTISRSIFYYFLSKISDFEVPLQVGEFQLIDRRVVDAILTYKIREPFIRTMIASVGFHSIVIPYDWRKREKGKSNFGFFSNARMALSGIFLFSSLPLRFCIFVGLLISLFCFIFGLIIFTQAIFGLASPPAGVFSMLLCVLFLFGVQLIFFGVMGEYIIQIHSNTIGGKNVFEREIMNFGDKQSPK